jgi:hypothetical protein
MGELLGVLDLDDVAGERDAAGRHAAIGHGQPLRGHAPILARRIDIRRCIDNARRIEVYRWEL